MWKFVTWLIGIVVFFGEGSLYAHSFKQRLTGYEDNDGLSRRRQSYGLGLENVNVRQDVRVDATLNYTNDLYRFDDISEDDYQKKIYGDNKKQIHQITTNLNQTWGKLTETRLLYSRQGDGYVDNYSYGIGVSRWVWSESLRFSVDFSRTVVSQPLYQYLDSDVRVVGDPSLLTANGVSLGVRHLASTTTIMDYGYSELYNSNRPKTTTLSVGARQFITELQAAVHGSVAYARNKGKIGLDTTYGEVDAHILDVNFLKSLWQGANARIGYREYKEREIERAFRDIKILASDTVSVGFEQEINPKQWDALPVPVKLEVTAARYANNDGVSAGIVEGGITATF